jgi:CBS domain containing-hemolysin-like protein
MKTLFLSLFFVVTTHVAFGQVTPYTTAVTYPLILAFPMDVSVAGR